MGSLRVVRVARYLFKDRLDEVKEILRVNIVFKGNALIVLKNFRVNVAWFLVFSAFTVAYDFEMLTGLFVLLNVDAL
jgi:hypothetical protein